MVGQLPEGRKQLIIEMRSSRACKNHFKIKLQGGAGQHQLEHLAAARIGRAGCDYNLPAAFVPAAAGRGNAATAALKRWRLGFAKANCLAGRSEERRVGKELRGLVCRN